MSIQYMVLEFEPMTFGTESPPITTKPWLSYSLFFFIIFPNHLTHFEWGF